MTTSVLDQRFDATSLSALRASTQACAVQAGMPADRATYQAGHGLWLARQVADQMMLRSDSCGTRAIIAFGLPETPA